MRIPAPVEHPADRSPARWVFDGVVTLGAGAAALPYLFHDNSQPRSAAIVVLAVIVAPLALRRIWPTPVFAWLLFAATAAGRWDGHLIPGAALGVALYTVAAMAPRRATVIAAALLEAAVVATTVDVAGGHWWFDAIFLTGMVTAAVGLGLYSATRRAYLAELRNRAERLELERDQQGALAAAAERARIAREMHDIVAHHLTVMVALSEGAIAAVATSPDRALEVMRNVSSTGRRALADTRQVLGVLREDSSEDPHRSHQPVPDLGDLDALIDQVRAAGLPTTLEIRGATATVSTALGLTVYRLVQEALTNTMKHGGPGAHATVRLHYLPGELRVEIDDDGAGSAAPTPVSLGAGLAGMEQRVRPYGGHVQSGPRAPRGWRVSAQLRLAELATP